ncbi:hypothetical protein [Bradyrhizobium sp. LCT2]|uniref:hypothetical protein n=1 Tax=Bradyrhizobium sp. LCT2 TaxID=2493093 RepID=UPI001FEDDFB9|nr:hypothetical protein [Bradyrhizobium sp. LCT2]
MVPTGSGWSNRLVGIFRHISRGALAGMTSANHAIASSRAKAHGTVQARVLSSYDAWQRISVLISGSASSDIT